MRVMGIMATKDHYVSISDAGTMKIDKKGKTADMTPKGPSRKLKCLHSQPDRQILSVSDTLGNVLIYSSLSGE